MSVSKISETKVSALDARALWQQAFDKAKLREAEFTTISGSKLAALYGPADAPIDYERDLGYPGQFPFTRGVHPTLYRQRLWTMRQFAGFGSAQQTNERFKFLLAHGQTGLSTAFDFPTLMGYDSDHERSRGEVGQVGVAISSLQDMQTLFDGIPMGEVSTSMTINGPAPILLAFYIACGERQGVSAKDLRGTVQNDILKEFQAQHAWLVPPEPALRLITDVMGHCATHVPQWNTISISGYHIREAGSTAAQELAFTLANGMEYVRRGIAAGLDVDEFAPRLSFFFDSHLDFFEEIAKFRAARRIWARKMRDVFHAKDPRSWMVRFHTQTAGVSLTAQQPENNIVRTAFEALAAVLGGTQSLHTNSMDETLALPTEAAVQVALRTQQVLAFETGVPNVIDPLGGSYYVVALTDRMEAEAEAMFAEIETQGGVVQGLEQGWFQRKIHESAARQQWEIEQHRRVIVGVNEFVSDGDALDIPTLKIGAEVDREQRARLAKVRAERDSDLCTERLDRLRQAARGTENVFPHILDCARSYCTLFEIRRALEDVFGAYREPVFF